VQLFIDSSNPEEIVQAREWGLIQGVTTNPTLIAKAGQDMKGALQRVLDVTPGVVLCQAVGWHESAPLEAQARWLHRFAEQIVVKLPMSLAGIQALQHLKQEDPTMPIAVTAVASVAQAYLAGKCGADIVAVFNGPLEQVVDQPVELVGPIRQMYRNYGFTTKILSCGRFPRSFGEFAVAGSDICTLKFEFLKLLFEHPFTDMRMNGFLSDWQSVFGEATWPAD
jgi:transaldolase